MSTSSTAWINVGDVFCITAGLNFQFDKRVIICFPKELVPPNSSLASIIAISDENSRVSFLYDKAKNMEIIAIELAPKAILRISRTSDAMLSYAEMEPVTVTFSS